MELIEQREKWIAGAARPAGAPRSRRRAGWILSGLSILFLSFDAVAKLLLLPPVVQGSLELGYAESLVRPIGFVLLLCVAAYATPLTAALGAVLLTGYLGGAVATHVRVGNPLPTHALFPVYVALLVWGGLWLREPRLRPLLPLRGRP